MKTLPALALLMLVFALPQQSFSQNQNQQKIDSLLALLPTSKEDTSKAKILQAIGYYNFALGKLEEATDYYQQTYSLSKKLNYKLGLSAAANGIGSVYLNKGETQKAIEKLEEGLHIGEEIGNRKQIGAGSANLAIVYLNLGKFDDALVNFKKALAITKEIGDHHQFAMMLNNISAVYRYKEQYNEAFRIIKAYAFHHKRQPLSEQQKFAIKFDNFVKKIEDYAGLTSSPQKEMTKKRMQRSFDRPWRPPLPWELDPRLKFSPAEKQKAIQELKEKEGYDDKTNDKYWFDFKS